MCFGRQEKKIGYLLNIHLIPLRKYLNKKYMKEYDLIQLTSGNDTYWDKRIVRFSSDRRQVLLAFSIPSDGIIKTFPTYTCPSMPDNSALKGFVDNIGEDYDTTYFCWLNVYDIEPFQKADDFKAIITELYAELNGRS